MTSQINPNNINGAYPVAGQDNNSQGFRDNFTNTKTNFQYAQAEITALQNSALLKAPLTSGGSYNNDMSYGIISNVQLKSQTYTSAPLGSLTTTIPLNYQAGTYQTATVAANAAIAFSNWPTTGNYATLRSQITTSVANVVITMPTAVGNGAAYTSLQYIRGRTASSQLVTIENTGTYVFEFSTADNGSTVFIQDLTRGAAQVPTA